MRLRNFSPFASAWAASVFLLLMQPLCTGETLTQPKQRYILFMRTQTSALNESKPESITPETFQEILRHFPAYDPEAEILVGVGGTFSYLKYDLDVVEKSLRRFLEMAEQTATPVWIKLDGEQWWEARPDLWNWWDPERPGFDPANARNVEWRDWQPDAALKIAWRDWGTPLRVLPPPNLMSPSYRQAVHEAMARLVPIIVEWRDSLPPEKKRLFAGVSVGWESGIGTSSYYLPNGNDLLDRPPEDDPAGAVLVLDDVLSRGVRQIGYAAVSTAGIRTSGDIEEDDLVEVVGRHLLDLSKTAHQLGLRKEEIYTHPFGNARGEKLYDAAVNSYATPGWSEYWHSDNILKNPGVLRNLHRPQVTQWGSVEWLLLYPVTEAQLWYVAISRTINAPGLKLMCIYNWENTGAKGPDVPRVVNRVVDEGLNPAPLPPLPERAHAPTIYEVRESSE